MPETWWQWLLLILGLVLALFVIKVTVTLDLNEVFAARRGRKIIQLQNACTHLTIEPQENGKLLVTSHFHSPPGTIVYSCSKCSLQSFNPELDFSGRAEYYAGHLEEYKKAELTFQRLLKKHGYLARG